MTKRGNVRDTGKPDELIAQPSDPRGKSQSALGGNHPLSDVIGTHEGPVWESILRNIQRNRKRADKEYAKELE